MILVTRIVIAVLAACGTLPAQSRLSGKSAQEAIVHAPAYVFGTSGAFIGIQRDFTVNSLWHLPRVEGITPLLPPVCPAGRADCYWYPENIVYDTSTATAFAVFPQKALSGSGEPQMEWQVIAFQLPEMAVAGHFPLPKCEHPDLLLRPGHQELFVNYTLPRQQGQPDFETVVDIYDTQTLKKKNSIHEKTNVEKYAMAQAVVNAKFSGAEFDRTGDVILSGLSRITFTATGFHKEIVDPVQILDEGERRKLEPFYRIQPVNNTRYLLREIADFNSGKALIVSESQDGAQMALWTVNLEDSKASLVMVVPAGIAHLIGNGTRILVEKTKAAPGSTAHAEKNVKLGTWTVYDAASGRQLLQKEVAVAKGPILQNELTCVWPDGSRALFRHAAKLYGVVLSAGGAALEIPAVFSSEPPLHCIFVP